MQEFNAAKEAVLQAIPDAEIKANRLDEYPCVVTVKRNVQKLLPHSYTHVQREHLLFLACFGYSSLYLVPRLTQLLRFSRCSSVDSTTAQPLPQERGHALEVSGGDQEGSR